MNHYVRSVRNHLNKTENNTRYKNEISSYILYLFKKAVIFAV